MKLTKEQVVVLYNEVRGILDSYPDSMWGFKAFGDDGVILIGDDLAKEKRREILYRLPHFRCVLFLKGLSKETYTQDRNLVQRVMMYGGSLPEWKWAAGEGEWKEFFQECADELAAMKSICIIGTSPEIKNDLMFH